MKHMKKAARAYRRLLERRTQGWYDYQTMDAGFDAGEWSGPAWADNWQRACERTEADIAKAFCVGIEALSNQICRDADRTFEKRWSAACRSTMFV